MQKLKKIRKNLKSNLLTIIYFELIFKIIMFLFFCPLFLSLLNLIMKSFGYTHITIENIFSLILNPLIILLFVISILLAIIFIFFEIITVITILDVSNKNEKINILTAVKLSLIKCKHILKIKNIYSIILILFILLIFLFLIFLDIIISIKILKQISINIKILFIISLIVLFISILLFKWIYSIHYLTLEKLSFKEARKKSINLNRKNYIKDYFKIFTIQILICIISFIIIFINILVIKNLNNLSSNIQNIIILILPILSIIIISTIFILFNCYYISLLYYSHKLEKKERKANTTIKIIKNKYKNLKYIIAGLGIVIVIFNVIFIYDFNHGKYNLNYHYIKLESVNPALVTGHRGASNNYPENTMSAFIHAKELGADWIELDVQQTKDGKIIVIHDLNFKRTTGVYKKTWELTYDEVIKLDAGKYLGDKFKNEKIPLFEDVVKWAKKNNIKLNVELKPNPYQTNLESKVIDIVKKLNYQNNCVITSQIYSSIKRAKEYDNTIETVFVTGEIKGDIRKLDAADHFSINEYFITPSLVNEVHSMGKQIYAWTIDDPVKIKKMIDLKVDNIITNNIPLAKNIIYLNRKVKATKINETTNIINDYIKLLKKYL